MRKKNLILLICISFIMLVMSGCSQEPKETEGGTANKLMFGIATGSTSASWYPMGGTLADFINNNVPGVKCWPEVSGSTQSNLQIMSNKECMLGFVASHGIFQIGDDNVPQNVGIPEGIRSVYFNGNSHGTFVVLADSDIKTVKDLKGKRVSLGAPGMGALVPGIHVLEAVGIDWKKDISHEFLTFAEQGDALISKRIDAFWFQITAMPAPSVVAISTSRDIRILDIPTEVIEYVQEKYGSYQVPINIPAGTYQGQDKDVQGIANFSILVAHKDLSDDVVYQITKMIYEKKDEMATAYSAIEAWDLDPVIDQFVPLHPGAEKFYREKGVLK